MCSWREFKFQSRSDPGIWGVLRGDLDLSRAVTAHADHSYCIRYGGGGAEAPLPFGLHPNWWKGGRASVKIDRSGG